MERWNSVKNSVKNWKQVTTYAVAVCLLVCVAVLSAVALGRTMSERSHIARVQEQMLTVQQIRALINHLQTERVRSCGFLRNYNIEKIKEQAMNLAVERAKTDRAADVMAAWPVRDGYRNRQEFGDTIADVREKIDKEQVQCWDIIIWYHQVVDVFIFDQIVSEFEYLGDQAKLWGQIHAYTTWILGTKDHSLGSGLASKLFSDGALDTKQYAYFFEIEGATYQFLKFSGRSSETVRHIYDAIETENLQVSKTMSDLKEEILINNFSRPDLNKSQAWQLSTTQYNRALSLGEQSISDAVLRDLESLWAGNTVELVLTVIVAGFCLTFCPLFALYYYMTHLRGTKKPTEKPPKLDREEQKKGNLLYELLPKTLATKVLNGEMVEPESFESVTVFCSDVVKFTNLSARCTPLQMVSLLNDLYSRFDTILGNHDCYKAETVADGFLVVSGLPKRNEPRHSAEMAEISLEVMKMISQSTFPHTSDTKLQMRIGLHTGPVVAGIVGSKRPYYCLFGDTVNTASRMESHGKGMHIHMSEWTRAHLLQYHQDFEITERGALKVKGKGQMVTYWLVGKRGISYKARADMDDQVEDVGAEEDALEQPQLNDGWLNGLPNIPEQGQL